VAAKAQRRDARKPSTKKLFQDEECMSLAIKRTVKGLCFFLLLIVTAGVARGQDASSALTGLITDPSGAAVANARVVATPATGAAVNARTGANGMYEFKTLAPGVYTLRATAKGFEPFVKAGVTIEPGKPISINMQLEIVVFAISLNISARRRVDINTILDLPTVYAGRIS